VHNYASNVCKYLYAHVCLFICLIFLWLLVESILNCRDTTPANVIISCVIYMLAVFIVSLMIKLLLRTYKERLTFVSHIDDVQYHLMFFFMEIVEITEQYCYTMIIGISTRNNCTLVVNNYRTARLVSLYIYIYRYR